MKWERDGEGRNYIFIFGIKTRVPARLFRKENRDADQFESEMDEDIRHLND
jgi:hypothetical protein